MGSHMSRSGQKTFTDRLIDCARRIPPGRVITYGDLVRVAGGSPRLARSVTHLLGKAVRKGEKDIPFHRIVYSDGRVWLDSDTQKARLALYKKEGISITKGKIDNFEQIRL